MGDKSPKSVEKKKGQKQTSDNADKKRRDDVEAAKRVVPAPPKK